MPIIFEKYTSPRITNGSGRSIERLYGITGELDEAAALALLEATAPSVSSGLPRQAVRLEPVGPDVWDGEAIYSPYPLPAGSTPAETGQSVYSFDVSAGTQRVLQSRETISSHAPGGATAPDFGGAIGVTADGIDGVDVVVPASQFAETHYISSASADALRDAILDLTGKVNHATFKGRAAGEVLFLGASGSKRGGPDGEDYEITFRFAVSPNATGLSVGDITGIDKKGWEYLWVRYQDIVDDDAGVVVKRPLAAYVERLYQSGDFAGLGIGT